MNRILVFIFGLILGVSATGLIGYFHAKGVIDTLHYWGVELSFAINAEQGVRHLKLLREERYEELAVILETKIKSDAEGLYITATSDGEALDSYSKKVLNLVADSGIEISTELPDFYELNRN